jgi:hypothetical protein
LPDVQKANASATPATSGRKWGQGTRKSRRHLAAPLPPVKVYSHSIRRLEFAAGFRM